MFAGANVVNHDDAGRCRNPDTLAKLQAAQKELKSADEDAYVNMEASNEEKDAGNAAFKAAKWAHSLFAGLITVRESLLMDLYCADKR